MSEKKLFDPYDDSDFDETYDDTTFECHIDGCKERYTQSSLIHRYSSNREVILSYCPKCYELACVDGWSVK